MFIAGRILGPFAFALTLSCGGALAFSQSDRDVQRLGNFLALQKLASKDGDTVRAFVKRVSTSYSKAGYDDFGPEFRRSGGEIIAQFVIGASDDNLTAARAALRKLEQALADDAFVALPAKIGSRLPDYFGLASAFTESAKVGLKNLTLGKNAANALRNNRGMLWLRNNGDGNFALLNSGGVIGRFTTSGAAADFVSGVVIYGGANINFVSSEFVLAAIGPVFNGGTVTLESTIATYWIAFPPDAEIPADLNDYSVYSVNAATTVNGTELAAGSIVYNVRNDYEAPPSAIILTSPDTTGITEPSLTPTPTPTPSPTPAE